MFKYLWCDKQILLYNECLEEEPMYILIKFRNNKIFTINKTSSRKAKNGNGKTKQQTGTFSKQY